MIGKARGLSLLWKRDVELEVFFNNMNVIACLIYSDPPTEVWMLILVYAPPPPQHPKKISKRESFWNLITSIITSFVGPWLLMGDCNSISASDNKFGGSSHDRPHKAFHDFVANAGAIKFRPTLHLV